MCTEEEKGKKSVYWLTVPVVVEFRGKKSGKKSTYYCQTKYFSTLEGIKRLQRCKTSQNDHSIYAGRLRRSFRNVNNFQISPPSAAIMLMKTLWQHYELKQGPWWITWHSVSFPSTCTFSCSTTEDGAPAWECRIPVVKRDTTKTFYSIFSILFYIKRQGFLSRLWQKTTDMSFI